MIFNGASVNQSLTIAVLHKQYYRRYSFGKISITNIMKCSLHSAARKRQVSGGRYNLTRLLEVTCLDYITCEKGNLNHSIIATWQYEKDVKLKEITSDQMR